MTIKERQAFEQYILKCDNNTKDTESLAEGLAEGWAKGQAKGWAEGQAEAKVSIARNLLAMNILTTEQIVQVTCLTEKELESLK